eukprot:837574-Rhodomonas_salina.1
MHTSLLKITSSETQIGKWYAQTCTAPPCVNNPKRRWAPENAVHALTKRRSPLTIAPRLCAHIHTHTNPPPHYHATRTSNLPPPPPKKIEKEKRKSTLTAFLRVSSQAMVT